MEGVDSVQIGSETSKLCNNFYYIRKPSTRIVVKLDRTTGNSDIIAVGVRSNKKLTEKLAKVANSQYDTKNKINPNAY